MVELAQPQLHVWHLARGPAVLDNQFHFQSEWMSPSSMLCPCVNLDEQAHESPKGNSSPTPGKEKEKAPCCQLALPTQRGPAWRPGPSPSAGLCYSAQDSRQTPHVGPCASETQSMPFPQLFTQLTALSSRPRPKAFPVVTHTLNEACGIGGYHLDSPGP